MKSIAALLLTIALALFPLSGTRVMAAVQAHAPVAADVHSAQGHAADHHHGAHHRDAAEAAHSHAGVADHGPHVPANGPCAGDHASSSCCSLSCHAMASPMGIAVPALRHGAVPLSVAALPLPRGIGFDGLLRPPRPA